MLIEATDTGQHVNFDFLLENQSGRQLKLTTVELSVFDTQGALARRDFVNLFSRASVAMQGEKVIPPHGSILLFNPMPDFAASVPLHRLKYVFSFTDEDYKGHAEAHAEVFPEAYKTSANLILPLRGRLVWDGHDLQSHHRRFDYTAAHFKKRGSDTNYQRYGYDFALVNERGSMSRGPEKVFDDWYRGPVVLPISPAAHSGASELSGAAGRGTQHRAQLTVIERLLGMVPRFTGLAWSVQN